MVTLYHAIASTTFSPLGCDTHPGFSGFSRLSRTAPGAFVPRTKGRVHDHDTRSSGRICKQLASSFSRSLTYYYRGSFYRSHDPSMQMACWEHSSSPQTTQQVPTGDIKAAMKLNMPANPGTSPGPTPQSSLNDVSKVTELESSGRAASS